jgi:hypothetical protein
MRRTAACIVLAAVLLLPAAASAGQVPRTHSVSWWNVLINALSRVVATVAHAVGSDEEGSGGVSSNSSITIDPAG